MPAVASGENVAFGPLLRTFFSSHMNKSEIGFWRMGTHVEKKAIPASDTQLQAHEKTQPRKEEPPS